MHRLSSSVRSFLSFMTSTRPRLWPPALARPVFPLMAVPNLTRRVSLFSCGRWNMGSISRGNEFGKSYRMLPVSCASVSIIPQVSKDSAVIQSTDNSEEKKYIKTRGSISEVIDEDDRSDDNACECQNVSLTDCGDDGWSTIKNSTTEIIVSGDKEVNDDSEYTVDDVLASSSHRDGSIYRDMDTWWKKEFCIANRNETGLEAMMLSDPVDCRIGNDGFCSIHTAGRMLQIFSLELSEIHVDGGLLELYGYVAVRDELDPLLNYIVNFSRDDPITVKQGSLISMHGPKRGIKLASTVLIEYDMRIKASGKETDDLQLIDGVSIISDIEEWNVPYIMSIRGDCGVIGLTFSRIHHAVEATVEVLISEVQSTFNLALSCLTSGLDEEIRVFHGAISEPRSLKRSVVAVVRNSLIELKFKVGTLLSMSDQYRCCFEAKTHGHDMQNIKTYFALISVKVTWSTLPRFFPGPTHYEFIRQ